LYPLSSSCVDVFIVSGITVHFQAVSFVDVSLEYSKASNNHADVSLAILDSLSLFEQFSVQSNALASYALYHFAESLVTTFPGWRASQKLVQSVENSFKNTKILSSPSETGKDGKVAEEAEGQVEGEAVCRVQQVLGEFALDIALLQRPPVLVNLTPPHVSAITNNSASASANAGRASAVAAAQASTPVQGAALPVLVGGTAGVGTGTSAGAGAGAGLVQPGLSALRIERLTAKKSSWTAGELRDIKLRLIQLIPLGVFAPPLAVLIAVVLGNDPDEEVVAQATFKLNGCVNMLGIDKSAEVATAVCALLLSVCSPVTPPAGAPASTADGLRRTAMRAEVRVTALRWLARYLPAPLLAPSVRQTVSALFHMVFAPSSSSSPSPGLSSSSVSASVSSSLQGLSMRPGELAVLGAGMQLVDRVLPALDDAALGAVLGPVMQCVTKVLQAAADATNTAPVTSAATGASASAALSSFNPDSAGPSPAAATGLTASSSGAAVAVLLHAACYRVVQQVAERLMATCAAVDQLAAESLALEAAAVASAAAAAAAGDVLEEVQTRVMPMEVESSEQVTVGGRAGASGSQSGSGSGNGRDPLAAKEEVDAALAVVRRQQAVLSRAVVGDAGLLMVLFRLLDKEHQQRNEESIIALYRAMQCVREAYVMLQGRLLLLCVCFQQKIIVFIAEQNVR
jgi:hypothetical protein